MPGKLQTRWLRPYQIIHVFDNGTVQLTTIDNVPFKLLVNGHRFKLYKWPQTKAEFLKQFEQSNPTTQVPLPAAEGENLPLAPLQY